MFRAFSCLLLAALPFATLPLHAENAMPLPALTKALEGNLVILKDGELINVEPEALAAIRYYAVYFSASWCPLCRPFTPQLIEAYKKLKPENPDFEVILVSWDHTDAGFRKYLKDAGIPWPAVRFDLSEKIQAINRYEGNYIPNLAFVKADGEVIAQSYEGDTFIGPAKVLEAILSTLGEKAQTASPDSPARRGKPR